MEARAPGNMGALTARLEAMLSPPICFAHRGARSVERENTLAAFTLALRLGATGLESDVWLTADGVPVLDHDGVVGRRPRRARIADLPRDRLPPHIPGLDELYGECGVDFDLSLDLKDPAAIEPVLDLARGHEQRTGRPVVSRLWLCWGDWGDQARWRQRWPQARLVNSTRLEHLKEGPERHAAALADAGIDTVNLPYPDWTGGLTTLFHRFEILCFGWNAQHDRMLDDLLRMGIDGLYSDHVDRMVDALARAGFG